MSGKESPAFRYWLLVGLVLHVVMGVLLQRPRGAPRHSGAAPPSLSEIELTLEDGPLASTRDGSATSGSERRSDTNVASAVLGEAAVPSDAADQAERSVRDSAAVSARSAVSAGSRGVADGARLASARAAASVAPGTPSSRATEPSATAGSAGDAASVDPVTAPRLSLDELGVGAFNPFLGDELAKPGAPTARGAEGAAVASARKLEQSIETALARRDQRIGLGPEGPAVRAVEALVMQSSTAPSSDATLFVRTDAEGNVVHTEVLAASSDGPEWERIARELARALAGKRMRVPSGSRGVSFRLLVASKEQLPSGAAPGLEINVLGATLKRGRGDNATKISILEPKITTQKVPLPHDPLEREVEAVVVSLVPFALRGDPVDIGAPARRVVRAHLRDLTVH